MSDFEETMAPHRSKLVPMTREDIPHAVELIGKAMNRDEADWAYKTMQYHFGCAENNLDDGRHYFIWQNEAKALGIAGLHHYHWGPRENVWLGWFAVDPELHGKGLGSTLFDEMVARAGQMGYKKMFIETYRSPTFEKARRFYQNKGFRPAGEIENYLPDGEAMIVFLKVLSDEAAG